MLLGSAACMLSPQTFYISILHVAFFLCLFLARLVLAEMPDGDRATHIFGRLWCTFTIVFGCFFTVGVNYAQLGQNADDYAVWIFAFLTMTIPMYMHLSGVHEEHRLVNNFAIGLMYSMSPGWTRMPHREASLIMWLSLLLGETAGMQLTSVLLAMHSGSSGFKAAADVYFSHGTGMADPNPFLISPRPASSFPSASRFFSLPEAARAMGATREQVDPAEATSTKMQRAENGWESKKGAGEPLTDNKCLWEMLRWFFKHGNCNCSTVRMLPLSLTFEDPRVEMLYMVSTFSRLHSTHTYACMAAIAICILGMQLSPPSWTVASIVIPYAMVLWLARRRVENYDNVPLAISEFAAWHTSCSLVAAVAYVSGTLRGVSGSPYGGWLPGLVAKIQDISGIASCDTESESDTTFGSTTLACLSLLLMLGGAHHRFISLPASSRMMSRSILIICVAVGNTDVHNKQLMPRAIANTVLAMSVLMLGELLGYSVALVRRSLFHDWLADAQKTFHESAAAAARVAAAEEAALELKRTNVAREAEVAADKRLNHVIKGRCGSAINSISSFRQLLNPLLSQPLPPEMEEMLMTPMTHLREAVEWCHRRQVFVQLERQQYFSRATPVNLNEMLLHALSGAGRLDSAVKGPVAVDVTVLKLVLDEVMSNALKYRRKDSSICITAEVVDSQLLVGITNINPIGFKPLSEDECERVFQMGYKSHATSAMSDGLGLDSVRRAVAAAHGAVKLTCDGDAMTTTVHLSLPVDVSNVRLGDSGSPSNWRVPVSTLKSAQGLRVAAPPADVCTEPPGTPALIALVAPRTARFRRVVSCGDIPAYVSSLHPPFPGIPVSGVYNEDGVPRKAIASTDSESSRATGATWVGLDYLTSPIATAANISGGVHGYVSVGSSESHQSADSIAGEAQMQATDLPGLASTSHSFFATSCPTPRRVVSHAGKGASKSMKLRQSVYDKTKERAMTSDSTSISKTPPRPPLPHWLRDESESHFKCPLCGRSSNFSQPPPHPIPTVCAVPKTSLAGLSNRKLRCIGIDDEDLPRLVHKILISHFLDADEESCSIGRTREEQAAFVDVAMGVRNPDLSYTQGEPIQADVVLLDENIDERADPPVMGSLLCAELRMCGFRGITVVLSGAPSDQIAKLRALPGVDLAYDKGAGLPVISDAIKKLRQERLEQAAAQITNTVVP